LPLPKASHEYVVISVFMKLDDSDHTDGIVPFYLTFYVSVELVKNILLTMEGPKFKNRLKYMFL
jgi:hypothetical protein